MPPHSRSRFFSASLSKGHTDRMSTDELRELTASSAVEVQRVCTLFSCLQQLVMAASIKPQLSPTSILPLLAYVTDGVDLLFQQDGISLRSVVPDTRPPGPHQSDQNSSGVIQGAADCPCGIQSRGHRGADRLFFPQCGSNCGAKFELVHRPDERRNKPQYGRCRGEHPKPASNLLLEPAAVQRAN